MSPNDRRFAVFVLLAACVAGSAHAQWSDDPASNLALADRMGGETIPLVGSTSDGGTYVAWFDNSAGSFRVYLQRLNVAGVEQWPHNGLLVSAHPQNTALFGWDMIVDSSDSAVIVFSDTRDGGDLDIHAYRIGPDGSFLWGPDGVTLSDNPDFEPAPRVTEASDGDLVFVWQRDPAVGDGDIRMQRLSPAGVPRLAPGGLPVVASANEDPGFVLIAPAENGNVILAWLRNIRTFASLRHLRARKFSPTGAALWPSHVEVYDAFSLPIGYFPELRPDGAGGAVLVWHRSDGVLFNSFVQRLDATGSELFPHNGVAVSTNATRHHIAPSPAHDPTTGATIVFWNERNSTQSQWGIHAQRITAAGTRAWGDAGLELLPVNTTFKSSPRAVALAGGAMAFLVDVPAGSDRLIGMRLDADGNSPWSPSPRVVSSAASGKSRYPVTIDGFGVAKLVWEDDRSGNVDIYGQNVHPDGSLGISPVPGTVGTTLRLGKSDAAPGEIVLSFGPSCSPGGVDYAIYEGTLGDFASHVARDCTDDGGDRVEGLVPGDGDRYYVVVTLGRSAEGSYGTDSDNDERALPPAAARCIAAQELTGCGP